jgi:serine-type D-Ala-D-Ala carboxypeptidase/endopeptidase (penicillin-binding protein 4)
MPRFAGVLALLALLGTPLGAQTLARRLDRLLEAPPFDRHFWGVVVLDSTGKVLFERNAKRLFQPASNTKLFASAFATALGSPDFTVKTSVYASGPLEDGIVHGDLVLYGRGDPTMSRRCFEPDTTRAGACETDPMRRMRELASQLRERGVRSVSGALVGDGSYFEPTLVHGTWETDDLPWWYAAPVSGLAFNDNSLDLHWGPGNATGAPAYLELSPDFRDIVLENRTITVAEESTGLEAGWNGPGSLWIGGRIARGSGRRTSYVAVPDPNRLAADALRSALAEAEISVQGPTASTTDSLRYARTREQAPLAETVSRPLSEWLVPILGPSQNLFAEMLLKQLGRQVAGEGSWRAALAAERRWLIDSVGVDSTQFSLRDGSGLSHANVASPLSLAKLLLWLRRQPNFAMFERALPVAGKSGTLRTRMIGTAVEGKVAAKTGSTFRVNSLSGYVSMPKGGIRIFSIQTNNHDLGGAAMIARIDSLVLEIGKR